MESRKSRERKKNRNSIAGTGSTVECLPLISCLMVSRGNLFPAHLAVQCYREQTYGNRELVIICAQPNSPLSAFVAAMNDPSVRYIESSGTLGDLRNLSVAEARGQLLCIWDDDDLYHRRRLERQAADHASGTAAHFLSRLLLWWPERRLLGISGQRPWENSMLVWREALPPYPPISIREDADLVHRLCTEHQISMSNEPELYCYIMQGQNVSGDAHFEALFESADFIFPDYDSELVKLSANFRLRWYADQINARKCKGDDKISTNYQAKPLQIYSEKLFEDQEVQVDGIHFQRCVFKGVALLYLGGVVPIFEDCDLQQTDVRFSGSAANTVNWLRDLKRAGMLSDL